MASGPNTIFDKSALQALNVDEACWFGNFFRINITPLFFVETLADLEKQVREGQTPEQVVGSIAQKTMGMLSDANVHHLSMCIADLRGQHIEMGRRPAIPRGRSVGDGDLSGIVFSQPPEVDALQRWQRGEFLEVERDVARDWRDGLTRLDLDAGCRAFTNLIRGRRARTLGEAKALADEIVSDVALGELSLLAALFVFNLDAEARIEIWERWRAAGSRSLTGFAPYAAYVLTVDLFFCLASAASLISRERVTNKVDIAYLYYLPFCMVVYLMRQPSRAHRAVLSTRRPGIRVGPRPESCSEQARRALLRTTRGGPRARDHELRATSARGRRRSRRPALGPIHAGLAHTRT